MARLNRALNIIMAPTEKEAEDLKIVGSRLRREPSRLNRSKVNWRVQFPAFPIIPIIAEGEEQIPADEEDLLVRCSKHNKGKGLIKGFQMIPLKACLHSPLRFDPKSKECKKCFSLQKKQAFPDLFLKAEKIVSFQEVLKVKGGEETEESEVTENEGD